MLMVKISGGGGPTRRPRRLRSSLAGDAGSASVELVLAVPLVLLLLLAIAQFALWSHASHIAQTAASEGLAATRVADGTPTAGHASAHSILTQLAGGPLRQPTVSVDRNTARARVRIDGTAQPVIPFLVLPVRADATGPVERIAANAGDFAKPGGAGA